MPPHASYLLQPLDVSCFGPLKTAYLKQIKHLVKNKIHYITKVEFLLVFKQAFDQTFTLSNIEGAFRGSSIFLFNPKAVLSRVGLAIRTLSLELPTQST
jgi:hypothetical protein